MVFTWIIRIKAIVKIYDCFYAYKDYLLLAIYSNLKFVGLCLDSVNSIIVPFESNV